MLTDESVKAVTTGALNQLDLDLCQCETFAVSEPVPGRGSIDYLIEILLI